MVRYTVNDQPGDGHADAGQHNLGPLVRDDRVQQLLPVEPESYFIDNISGVFRGYGYTQTLLVSLTIPRATGKLKGVSTLINTIGPNAITISLTQACPLEYASRTDLLPRSTIIDTVTFYKGAV